MKKFASILLAAFLSFGALALTACGGKDESSSPATESSATTEASVYKITVLNADGTPATNVKVQLCIVDESGKLGACLMPVAVNADGKVDYTADKNTYEIHVLDSANTPLELKEHVVTEAEYGEYTVTLAK